MYKGERFNSLTHIVGALLACVGFVFLMILAIQQNDLLKIVSFAIYGSSLILLYTFSSLYHSLKGKAKRIFQKLDHNIIYLFIAGTYTPFTLITLKNNGGWWIFSFIWFLAFCGVVLELLPKAKRSHFPVIVYLVMGWFILVAFKPLLEHLTKTGTSLLVIGGILYTVGVFFYVFDTRVRHFHGIWHLFVMAGSLAHYLAILFYVAFMNS